MTGWRWWIVVLVLVLLNVAMWRVDAEGDHPWTACVQWPVDGVTSPACWPVTGGGGLLLESESA